MSTEWVEKCDEFGRSTIHIRAVNYRVNAIPIPVEVIIRLAFLVRYYCTVQFIISVIFVSEWFIVSALPV